LQCPTTHTIPNRRTFVDSLGQRPRDRRGAGDGMKKNGIATNVANEPTIGIDEEKTCDKCDKKAAVTSNEVSEPTFVVWLVCALVSILNLAFGICSSTALTIVDGVILLQVLQVFPS
jgi:hypothetical protein